MIIKQMEKNGKCKNFFIIIKKTVRNGIHSKSKNHLEATASMRVLIYLEISFFYFLSVCFTDIISIVIVCLSLNRVYEVG